MDIRKYLQICLHFIKYQYYKITKSQYYSFLFSHLFGRSIAVKYNQSIKIDYIYDGTLYSVYLPFERKLVPKMLNRSVIIKYEDSETEIKQQPGVPYFITPKHIGGKLAIVYSTIQEEKQFAEMEKIEL